jgi:hypothetical protein
MAPVGAIAWAALGHRMCGLVNTALKTAMIFITVFFPAAGSAWAQTLGKSEGPPPFPTMTYDEDNLYFADPAHRSHFPNQLKFIPLFGGDTNYYLSFGANIRERGEYFNNPNWGSGPAGSAYLMQRYYLHADLSLGERVRFFGELGSSFEDGRTGGPRAGLDEDRLDLHQGFVDFELLRSDNNRLTLRAGRQEMAFGSGMLVSTRDGRNIRVTWDGFRATWKADKWTVDGFAVKETKNEPGIFDDQPNQNIGFWGVYAVRPFPVLPGGNIDLYYLGRDNKDVSFDARGVGDEQRETIGTRLWGTTGHWSYNDEFAFQFGHFRSDEILAWAASTETGYQFDSMILHPRFGLRAVAFSGDQNPSGGALGTFNSLNEKGPYFTYAELFARRNLIALQPSVRLDLAKNVSLTPNAAFYGRESTRDGIYSTGGAVEVTGQKSNARYIGSQTAVQLEWKINRNLTFTTEYLHFFPGQFLEQSTPGRSIDYVTGFLDFKF